MTRRTDNAMPNVTVTAPMEQWERFAKALFGWRTRAGYATWNGRIQALGSSDYDRLIMYANDRLKEKNA